MLLAPAHPKIIVSRRPGKSFFFLFLLSWPVRSFLFQNTVSVHCFRLPPLKTSAWILATGHDGLASRVRSVSLQEKCREKEKENSRVISSTFNKLQAYSSCRTGSFWKHLHQAEESRLLGIHHKSWGPERWGLFSDGSTRACKAKSLQDVKKRLLLDVWPWYQWVCEIISWSTKDRRKFDLEWGTFRGVPLSRDLGLYPHRNRSCNTHFLDITYHLLGITHWSLSPRCTDQHKEIVIHFLQHTCLAQSLQCNSGGKNDFCHEFVLWKT